MRPRFLLSALAGMILLLAAANVQAGWFWRARTVYPSYQTTARQTSTFVVQSPSYQRVCTPHRTTRMRSGFPQSSQDLYHHLNEWPPYSR